MNAVAARPYRMTARAARAAQTADRILAATVELFWENPGGRMSLDEVARRASVTEQTVIRRFGSKPRLIAAAAEREAARIARQRDPAAVSDTRSAVRQLVDHYEEMGERVLRMLAEETRTPELTPMVDQGRAMHRAWCAAVFAKGLGRVTGQRRKRRLAELVALCDVQTWKLLRRDAGLTRRQTEIALMEMLRPLLEER